MPVRVFGEVIGTDGNPIPVGTVFRDRDSVAAAGIHRPPMAGISGTEAEGADSIVVSGGYEDDKDYGDEIIYTGHGGQDPVSKRQIKDQEFRRGNRALVVSQNEGLPVRVVRGAHKGSTHAPASGYRYDGLYRVADSWQERGAAGFLMCRFQLVRWEDTSAKVVAAVPPPRAPRRTPPTGAELPTGNATPSSKTSTVQRTIRNTAVGTAIKRLYDYRCQICGVRLESASGPYAEAAHIRALRPHNGPDVPENVLCLCPNHHTLFDLGAFYINDDFSIGGLHSGKVTLHERHRVDLAHVRYHRERHASLGHPAAASQQEESGED